MMQMANELQTVSFLINGQGIDVMCYVSDFCPYLSLILEIQVIMINM